MAMSQKRREQLQVLTADVRILVLKAIHKRYGTIDRLADKLRIPVSVVKTHINRLKKVKLIEQKKDNEGKKRWVPTLKGLAILDPEEKIMWITGSLFIVSIAAATAGYIQSRLSNLYNPQVQTATSPGIGPFGIILLLAIVIVFAVILMRAHQRRKKYEQFLK